MWNMVGAVTRESWEGLATDRLCRRTLREVMNPERAIMLRASEVAGYSFITDLPDSWAPAKVPRLQAPCPGRL